MAIWATKLNEAKFYKAKAARVRMLETFLQTEMENMIVSSLVAATALSEKWGLVVDWHEFSDVLAGMEAKGLAETAGIAHNRVQRYRIIPQLSAADLHLAEMKLRSNG